MSLTEPVDMAAHPHRTGKCRGRSRARAGGADAPPAPRGAQPAALPSDPGSGGLWRVARLGVAPPLRPAVQPAPVGTAGTRVLELLPAVLVRFGPSTLPVAGAALRPRSARGSDTTCFQA